jgi:alkylhydroperoxidase family enzyme
MPQVQVDASTMPRFGLSPVEHSEDQAQAFGIGRHPSMAELGRRTLMWNPPLQEAQGVLAGYLRHSQLLSQRDREIAILRQAWAAGADYQWGMHSQMGLDAGLTSDEIAQLARNPEDGAWTPHELAVIRAVDELNDANRIGDETWKALREDYDEAQVIEFLVLVGSYRLTAWVFNSVGIRPPSGSSPDLPGNSFSFL